MDSSRILCGGNEGIVKVYDRREVSTLLATAPVHKGLIIVFRERKNNISPISCTLIALCFIAIVSLRHRYSVATNTLTAQGMCEHCVLFRVQLCRVVLIVMSMSWMKKATTSFGATLIPMKSTRLSSAKVCYSGHLRSSSYHFIFHLLFFFTPFLFPHRCYCKLR